jgi:outer membrane protein assembly factor BamB
MEILRNRHKISTITLLTVLTLSILTIFPMINAQETLTKKTYPYLGAIPNPAAVDEQMLFHVGISAQLASTHMGWEGLSITIQRPDGQTDTISDITTDATGGTGVPYTPDMVGKYIVQMHFPEQAITAAKQDGGRSPVGTMFLASDSEELEVIVQEESLTYWPGVSLPTEYWTRPINAQFYEWKEISGDWLRPAGTYIMPPIPKYHSGNADAPETGHILWTKPYTQGGLVSVELGNVQYEMGDAYEEKFRGSVIMSGVLYYNRYEWQGSNPDLDQDVVAVDLKTGEELWVKNWNNERLQFGQTFFWDSYNYHGVFGYLWTDTGAGGFGAAGSGTWKAYDPLTGRWEYTMENVPGGYNLYGPKGEIYRYTVNTRSGTLSFWNSSRVVSNEGSWRPQGNTYDAKRGIEWTIEIPTLPGSDVSYHLFDKIVGSSSGGIFGGTSPDITNWAIDVSPGNEGSLIFNKTVTLPESGTTLVYCDTIPENDVLIVSSKETLRYHAFSLTNGTLLWTTEPEGYLAFYDKWYGPAYGYGKFFTGRASGIVTCYDLETGEVLWDYDVRDQYSEMTWSNNFHIAYHFLADGKICLSYSEHSPLNPIPRGGPLVVLDVENGTKIWELSWINNWWGGHVMIGDSTIVGLNGYDNRLYAIGKGPSETTVSIQNDVISLGSSVMIKGTVMDVSPGTEDIALQLRFPNGVPAMADENMTDWMHYVYMQWPLASEVEGVEVFLKIQDPNGDWYSTTVTTDENGVFSHMWAPAIAGEYHVTAMFEGSKSYYASQATTAFGVDEAAADVPSATEIADTTVGRLPAYPAASAIAQETVNKLPAYLTIDLVILVIVAVVLIIGLIAYMAFRKQK